MENTEETSRRWKTYGSATSGGGGEPPLSCAQSVFDGKYRIEDRLFSSIVEGRGFEGVSSVQLIVRNSIGRRMKKENIPEFLYCRRTIFYDVHWKIFHGIEDFESIILIRNIIKVKSLKTFLRFSNDLE